MKSAGKGNKVVNLAKKNIVPDCIENGNPLSQLVVLYVGVK
jgi:hypothetical protein